MMGMGMGGGAPMPPMGPPMGAPMGAPPMGGMGDPTDMVMSQLQMLFQKWGAGEMQIAGEKGALSDMLMMLLTAQAPTAPMAFSEPGIGASMVGAPMEDVPGQAPPMGY